MSTPSDDAVRLLQELSENALRAAMPHRGPGWLGAEGIDDAIKRQVDEQIAHFPQAVQAEPLQQGVHAAMVAATPGAVALSGIAALWNAGADMMYYDVPALTPHELVKLCGLLLSQGTALIVHPRQEGADGVEVINGNDFVTEQRSGKSSIDTLAIPGVGSTAIAAASFARNLADALGKPVAAIVPGYGAADLLADACGGWFVLGANNSLLETAAKVNAMGFRKSAKTSEAAGGATFQGVDILGNYWPSPIGLLLNETNEVSVLRGLFCAENNLRLLVGHSKGCLALAFALHAAAARDAWQMRGDMQIVTIGCVTYFPPIIPETHLHQYLGSLDTLGALNSRRDIYRTGLVGKTHSLNSLIPTSVRVADVLRLARLAP